MSMAPLKQHSLSREYLPRNRFPLSASFTGTRYQLTLFFKLALVAVSGIAAFLHTQSQTRVAAE